MEVQKIMPADEAAWHAARGQDVTASVAAGLLGIHPYTTPYQLWAEKTGRVQRSREERAAMRRGRLLEPVAVQILAEERPTWIVEYHNDRAYYRDSAARIGATPDVFATRRDMPGRGIVQIKTASHEAYRSSWLDPDTHDVVPPLWIAVQTIIEAKLTGATWASVAVLIWNRDALHMDVIDIPINEKVWTRVVRQVAKFWSFVDSGEEMDPDWERDSGAVLSVFGESMPNREDLSGLPGIDLMIERYQAAGEEARRAKVVRDTIKPQLIYCLGNSEAGFTERWDISAPTVRKDEHVVKGTQYRGLRIKPRRDR